MVYKEDENPPQGNELESPFGESVVTRCRVMTARTHRAGALAQTHCDLNTPFVWTEAGLLVDKSREAVASVYNRD